MTVGAVREPPLWMLSLLSEIRQNLLRIGGCVSLVGGAFTLTLALSLRERELSIL